jgi:hypothetical protein
VSPSLAVGEFCTVGELSVSVNHLRNHPCLLVVRVGQLSKTYLLSVSCLSVSCHVGESAVGE